MRLKSNNHVIPGLKEMHGKNKMKEKERIEMQEVIHMQRKREKRMKLGGRL